MKSLVRVFFKILFFLPVWFLYRIRPFGRENIPKSGGVLLLSNHVSYIDSFILYYASPRPVRFVVLENYTKVRGIAWFVKLFGGIPIRPEKAKEAIQKTAEALLEGGVVCLFPEGGLTRLGVTTEFKKGFELIVRKADCPVVPVYMDGLFESIFSFERGRYFKKRPQAIPCRLQVSFGKPIPPGEAVTETVRLGVWEQSVNAYARRREFEPPLEVALIRALKKNRRRILYAEYAKNGPREWTRSQILAMTVALARRWMNDPNDPGQRIGILLPPGPMTSLINLGLFLGGKTPVNLPFTIDPRETEKIARSVAPLGIRTVITSRAFMPHLMDFWHGEEGVFIDLKSVISAAGAALPVFEKLLAAIEPAWVTCWRLDLKRRDHDREAVGLVPRPGDDPVFLSSAELHQDSRRVFAANFARQDDTLFSELPLSLPEGLLFGCWAPVLGRERSVCRSFSLREDGECLERALLEQGVTLLAGDEAFYRGIEGAIAVQSVKYGHLFGPVEPWSVRELAGKLEMPLCRGASHRGRILSLSRPDPDIGDAVRHQSQVGADPRSIGRLLPGVAGRVRDDRLWLSHSPADPERGHWSPGPKSVEIAPDGLLYPREPGAA